jgi:hypothetical protein
MSRRDSGNSSGDQAKFGWLPKMYNQFLRQNLNSEAEPANSPEKKPANWNSVLDSSKVQSIMAERHRVSKQQQQTGPENVK